MTIIEEILEKSIGDVSVEDFRDYIRELIKEKYKDSYEINDCLLFVAECLLFRGIRNYDIKTLYKGDVNLVLTLMEGTEIFKENIKECEQRKIVYMLWNCIYNYLDLECFQLDDEDLEKMKKETMYLSKVLEYYDVIESGNLSDVALEHVSVYELKLAIGEFLEYVFTNELN